MCVSDNFFERTLPTEIGQVTFSRCFEVDFNPADVLANTIRPLSTIRMNDNNLSGSILAEGCSNGFGIVPTIVIDCDDIDCDCSQSSDGFECPQNAG